VYDPPGPVSVRPRFRSGFLRSALSHHPRAARVSTDGRIAEGPNSGCVRIACEAREKTAICANPRNRTGAFEQSRWISDLSAFD
jgi:hypothetical protein